MGFWDFFKNIFSPEEENNTKNTVSETRVSAPQKTTTVNKQTSDSKNNKTTTATKPLSFHDDYVRRRESEKLKNYLSPTNFTNTVEPGTVLAGQVMTGDKAIDSHLRILSQTPEGKQKAAEIQMKYFEEKLQPLVNIWGEMERFSSAKENYQTKYQTDPEFKKQYDGLMKLYNGYANAMPTIEENYAAPWKNKIEKIQTRPSTAIQTEKADMDAMFDAYLKGEKTDIDFSNPQQWKDFFTKYQELHDELDNTLELEEYYGEFIGLTPVDAREFYANAEADYNEKRKKYNAVSDLVGYTMDMNDPEYVKAQYDYERAERMFEKAKQKKAKATADDKIKNWESEAANDDYSYETAEKGYNHRDNILRYMDEAGEKNELYEAMTGKEKHTYNWLLGKYGFNEANEYMLTKEHIYNERINKDKIKEYYEYAKENKGAAAAKSFLSPHAGIMALMGGLEDKVLDMMGNTQVYDPYDTTQMPLRKKNAYREGTKDGLGKIGTFFADIGYSMGDVVTAMPFGPNASLAILGTNAAGDKFQSVMDNGGSLDQALGSAIVSGTIEVMTEKIGIDNLFDMIGKPSANIAKSIAKQMGAEAAEEGISAYANFLADESILGRDSDFQRYKRELMQNEGLSEEEAERKAAVEYLIKQPILSMLAGGLSGAGMGTGASVLGRVAAGIEMGDNYAYEIEKGRGAIEGSNYQQLAEKMGLQEALREEGAPSIWEKGKLAGEREAYFENNETVGKRIVEEGAAGKLLGDALAAPADTKTRAMAEGIKARLIDGATISEAEVGELYNLYNSENIENSKFEKLSYKVQQPGAVETVQGAGGKNVQTDPLEKARENSRKDFGEAGQKSFETIVSGANTNNVDALYKGYARYYEAGRSGLQYNLIPETATGNAISEEVRMKAFASGVADAKSDIALWRRNKSNTIYYGKNAGIVKNEYSERLSYKNRSDIDNIAKALGVKIEIVKSVKEGRANGEYIDGVIRIASDSENPVTTTVVHEAVHRLKEVDIEAYNRLAKYVAQNFTFKEVKGRTLAQVKQAAYENAGVQIDIAEATEENVADFIANIVENKAEIKRLASNDLTLSEKLGKIIRDIINAIKTAFGRGGVSFSQEIKNKVTALEKFEKELSNVAKKTKHKSDNSNKNGSDNKKSVKYMITEIKSSTKSYGEGVFLNTDIFEGTHPRNWNKILRNFVYNNLAGKVITVYNKNGTEENIYFARKNERVLKDGANNNHKVIDKLAKTKGNVNALMTVHIDEILEVAGNIHSVNENNHQWLDKNGWEYKTVYVQTIKGDIYESTLNIAKARDGRNIMYAFSNTKRVEGGVVPSTVNGRGSHTSINSYDIVTQPEETVKPSDAKSSDNNNSMQKGGKYSLKDKITPNMDDDARYEILKDKKINVVPYNKEKLESAMTKAEFEKLRSVKKGDARRILEKLGEEFGVFRNYLKTEISLEFTFSKSNLKKSVNLQKKEYQNYAKMMSVFTEVINNAVGIETHRERYNTDSTLQNTYVFMSAFLDGKDIIPVKMEVKEFSDKENTLYVAVSLRGIKNGSDFVARAANSPEASDSHTSSTSTYMVADILRNVNTTDEDLIKYIPDKFLETEEQRSAKQRGLEKTKKYIEEKNEKRYSKNSLKGANTLIESGVIKEHEEGIRQKVKETDTKIFDRKAIRGYARKYISDFGSKIGSDIVEEKLNALYEKMASGSDSRGMLSFDDFRKEARGIAREILQNVSVVDAYAKERYDDFLSNLKGRTIHISESDAADIPDYNEWRKGYVFRLNVKKTAGYEGNVSYVDTVYAELSAQYPDLISGEAVAPSDMLLEIGEVIDKLSEFTTNPFEGDSETAALLTNDILDSFFDVPQLPATEENKTINRLLKEADKVKESEAEKYRKKLKKVKDANKRAIEETIAEERKRQRSLLDSLTGRFMQRQQKIQLRHYEQVERLKEAQREGRANQRQRMQKSRLIEDIRTAHKHLSSMLLNPTEQRFVPENLRGPVAEFLQMFDITSSRTKDRGKERMTVLFDKLSEIEMQSGDSGALDPDLKAHFEELSEVVEDGKKIDEYTNQELMSMKKSINAVRFFLRNLNKAFGEYKRAKISELGELVMNENMTDKGYVRGDKVSEAIKGMLNFDMLDSFRFFEAMGSTAEDVFSGLRKGFDRYVENINSVREYAKGTLKGFDVKAVTGNTAKAHRIKLGSGETVDMTKAEIMSLYLLSKREQALSHIMGGGIKLEAENRKMENKSEKYKASFEPVKIDENDLAQIIGTLSAEEKRIAEELALYFTQTATWGNEVSMELYGYEKFNDGNYFPIKVYDAYLNKDFDGQDPHIKNAGFTKSVVKGASNPIVVQDIFDVFINHTEKMALYNAFVLPLNDMQKVWNYKSERGTVKEAIEKRFGKKAQEYFDNFMKDLNGGAQGQRGNRILNMLLGKVKASAVGLNLSVIVQQPTAIIRAFAEIDPKYFTQSLNYKNPWEFIKEKAPVAQWKDWGYFQFDTGRSTKDIILDKRSASEVVMWGAAKGDEFGWTRIFNACEAEVRDLRSELKKGSDEYWQAVADRFTEIIDKTQVIDSVFHRSQMMRSPDGMQKLATSFMGEPTKGFNMLWRAFNNAKNEGSHSAKKKAAITLAAYTVSVVINNAVRALVQAWRDDEDKEYFEKWLTAFSENLMWEPTSMLPVIKDIASIVQGYDVKRMEYNGISAVVSSVKNLFKDKETPAYKVINLVSAFGDLFGLATSSAKREISTILENVARFNGSEYFEYLYTKSLYSIDSSTNKSRFMNILFKSVDNQEAFEKIKADMLKHSQFDEESIQKSLNSKIKKATKSDKLFEQEYNSIISEFEADESFKNLDEEAKETAYEKAEEYALLMLLGDEEHYTGDASDIERFKEATEFGISPADQILFKVACDAAKGENNSISVDEKYDVVAGMNISDDQKAFLYMSIGSDSSKKNKEKFDKVVEEGKGIGVTGWEYIQFKELCREADKKGDGNGSLSQKEIVALLGAIDWLTPQEKNYFIKTRWPKTKKSFF